MRNYKAVTLFFLMTLVLIGNAWACKTRDILDEYPVKEVAPSTTLVVARVVEIIKKGDEHHSVDQFKIKVMKTYQGKLVEGKTVFVSKSYGPSHGMCPVFVKKGHSYIMVLWHIDGRYQISPYNYLVDSKNRHFKTYIQQLDQHFSK